MRQLSFQHGNVSPTGEMESFVREAAGKEDVNLTELNFGIFLLLEL